MKNLFKILFFFFAGTLILSAKTVEITGVFNDVTFARESNFYVKSGTTFKKLEGGYNELGQKKISVDAKDNLLEIFRKEGGEYVPVATAPVVENNGKIGLSVFKDVRVDGGFAARTFALETSKLRAGTLTIANYYEKLLRAKIDGIDGRTAVPAGEQVQIFALTSGTDYDITLRLIAPAKTKEAAKKSWRWGNNFHLAKSEAYLIVVLQMGRTNNDRDLCQVLLLRISK